LIPDTRYQKNKDLLIGITSAIAASGIGFLLYVFLLLKSDLATGIQYIQDNNLYGETIGLSSIPNLLVFFVFIKKKMDIRAKGVLLITVFEALAVALFRVYF